MPEENKGNTPQNPEQPAVEKPVAQAAPSAAPAAPAAAKPAAPAAAAPAKPVVPPKPAGPTPQPWETEFTRRIKQLYGSGVRETSSYVGQNYMVIDRSVVHDVLRMLRDDEGFDYLVDLTAVNYPKREEQFDIVYILYSFKSNERVRVKTLIKEDSDVLTATDLWPTANWLERECYDMFGVQFTGHPDLRRILLPEGWKGHPLRKDYPILQQDKEWVQINLGIESGQ